MLERTPWPTLHSLLGIDAADGLTDDVADLSLAPSAAPSAAPSEPMSRQESFDALPSQSKDASALLARLHA